MVKKTFIIDMQNHYIPSEAFKLVRKTSEYDYTIGIRRLAKAYRMITDIDEHLRWMDVIQGFTWLF